MRPLRTIVVDDEDLARRRLIRLLADLPTVQVIGEASGGMDALTIVSETDPDLLFLDIQMPGLDGFGTLAQMARQPRAIVFTTAYDRYAVDAFAVGAVDYLLKPFGVDELARAIRRAASRTSDGYEKLLAAVSRPRYLDRIPVTYLADILLIAVSDVTYFEAESELVTIHTSDGTYRTDLTLAELEQRLDPERFFRAHRKAIINLDRLVRLTPADGGRLIASMGQRATVELSRTGSKRLREKLGI